MQSYDYFVIHTHGSKTGFKINGTTANNLTMSELSGTDLSNIDFALLLTCYTGQDFDSSHIINNTPVNIIEQMVICGAETVIGFNNETKVTDCNRFAPALLERVFVDGMLLEEALDDISYLLYYYNMKERCEIAGDVDQVIR